MKKVICIGSTSKDIFFPTQEGKIIETPEDVESQRKIAFELGAKFHINDRFESFGGCGANQAVGLSRLGMSVECYTSIGDDSLGEWIKKEMDKENVGTGLVMSEKGCLSGLSAIVVDQNSGERIIFSNQEANEKLKVDPEKLAGADFVSITDLSGDWRNIADTAMDFCQRNNIKVAFNPRGINIKQDPKKVFELADKCEIFFVNKDEAIEIISALNGKGIADENLNDEKYLLEKLGSSGVQVAVVTDGKRGAWAYDGKNLIWAQAANETPKETTGAGDAFASGFLGAYIHGKNLGECLQWGAANAGHSVNFYGGVEGLLKEREIEEKIKNIGVKVL